MSGRVSLVKWNVHKYLKKAREWTKRYPRKSIPDRGSRNIKEPGMASEVCQKSTKWPQVVVGLGTHWAIISSEVRSITLRLSPSCIRNSKKRQENNIFHYMLRYYFSLLEKHPKSLDISTLALSHSLGKSSSLESVQTPFLGMTFNALDPESL